MPRRSPFQVALTASERKTLEGRARQYTSPYRDVIRAKIVLLAAEGLGNDVIAAPARHAPRQIVSKWRKRFCLWRLPGLDERAPGRPAAPLFPPASWSRSRRWRVSCRPAAACRCRSGRGRTSSATSSPRASSRRSAGRRSGAGSPADAIRPWRVRSWLFPRDPAFAAKAGRVLDLYERRWDGVPLGPTEYVLSADEKTSIQARGRCHPTQPAQPGRPMRVEHEYVRGGAWAYHAAWDVHRAKVFGRCEATTGIAPFDRLVAQVMTQEPYRSAAGSSGSSTTAPPIGASGRSRASRPRGRRWSWSTRRSTPVGSTRSRSTSPSSSARS